LRTRGSGRASRTGSTIQSGNALAASRTVQAICSGRTGRAISASRTSRTLRAGRARGTRRSGRTGRTSVARGARLTTEEHEDVEARVGRHTCDDRRRKGAHDVLA
jgi:uncharacterized Ntn-hydrolase superfamily protein